MGKGLSSRHLRAGNRQNLLNSNLQSGYDHMFEHRVAFEIRTMDLSNKKIKYIKRHASKKTPEELARELKIKVKDVQKVLGSDREAGEPQARHLVDLFFRWGLALLPFLAPLVFIKGIYDFANLPQLALIQAGVVLLLILWLIRETAAGHCRIVKSPFNLPILGFILWSLVSVLYAHNGYEGLLIWMHAAACALMYFLVLNGMEEETDPWRICTAIFLAGFLSALLGIFQHIFNWSWIPQVVPPAATFANKNMAVHFIILTFPLAVGLILNSRQRIWTWILCLMAGLMLVFLMYAKTRAGWVALTVEILVFGVLLAREYFRSRKFLFWNRAKSLAAGVAILIAFLMTNLGPEGFKWGFGEVVQRAATMTKATKSVEETAQSEEDAGVKDITLRKAIWVNTLEMIKDKFFIGYGLGNHKLFYPLYHHKVVKEQRFSETSQLSNVHNDYLQAFAELGIVGMLLLVWFAFSLIKVVLHLTTPRYDQRTRIMVMAMAVAAAGLAVNACFSFPFERSVPPFVLMIYTGIFAYLYAGEEKRGFKIRKTWFFPLLAVIAFLLLLWLIRFHYLGILCDRHYLNVTQLEKRQDWKKVVTEGEKAYHYNPHRVKTLSYIGRAYIETGQYEKGIEALKKVIADYPNHMNALLNIGVAYSGLEQFDLAFEAYEKVLRIKPDYAKVHNNMANIYMKQKNLDKALEEFRIAARLDPENSVIHFNVGVVEMQKELYAEAAQSFEKSIRLNPKWALSRRNLGLIYAQYLKRPKEGLVHLKKALELDPKIKEADQLRKLIEHLEKQNP